MVGVVGGGVDPEDAEAEKITNAEFSEHGYDAQVMKL